MFPQAQTASTGAGELLLSAHSGERRGADEGDQKRSRRALRGKVAGRAERGDAERGTRRFGRVASAVQGASSFCFVFFRFFFCFVRFRPRRRQEKDRG